MMFPPAINDIPDRIGKARVTLHQQNSLQSYSYASGKRVVKDVREWYLGPESDTLGRDYMRVVTRADHPKTSQFSWVVGNFELALLDVEYQPLSFRPLPQSLRDEGVSEPSVEAQVLASKYLRELSLSLRCKPSKVAASIVGGVLMEFNSMNERGKLVVEIDNDLDATAVFSKDGQYHTADLADQSEKAEIVNRFLHA